MKLADITKIISRNWLLLAALTLVTAASIYFFVRNQKAEYTSTTTIYTGIATGYDLSNSNSQQNTAANAFANLISIINSKEIKKEVGFKLLASHLMLKEPNENILAPESFQLLQEMVPASLRNKLVRPTVEETSKNLQNFYQASDKNVIRDAFNSEEFSYSEEALETILAERIGESDLLMISYTSGDPAVSKMTLEILSKEFLQKEKSLHTGKSQSIVEYFEETTAKALERLKQAETNMLAFQQENNVIDYNAQVGNTLSEKNSLSSKFNDLDLEYTGAQSNLKSLERKLKDRGLNNIHSQEVLQLKSRLAKVNTQIAEREALSSVSPNAGNSGSLSALKREAEDLRKRMLTSVDQHYADSETAEGLPTASLLEEWVKATFLVEELKSKRSLVSQQQGAYTQNYDKLLPLGAENKKLIRDVTLAEQEYLAQLEGLKQSKLNQQNFELMSQLQVVDPPHFPSDSSGLTKILLVVLGALGVFLLTLGILVANALLDQTLRKPSVAVSKIKYPIFGILPAADASRPKQLQLAQNAEDQLARQLILKMKHKGSSNPFVVGVLSSMAGEGKTSLCKALASNLNAMGVDTQVLYPESHKGIVAPHNQVDFYAPLQGVLTDATVADLAGLNFLNSSIVIVEFPAVLEETYPVSLLKHLDLILLTVKANRVWQQADKVMFENIQKVTTTPIETVLSSVTADDAKENVFIKPKDMNHEQKVLSSPKTLPALENV